jgi:hypothetical protein
MKSRKKALRIAILMLLISLFSYTASYSYAFWASNVTGNQDIAFAEVPVGEWGLAVGPPQGIPEYVQGDTYEVGDYVWYEGKIYQIISGDYASAPPPSSAPYGAFNEIYHEYIPTNTYYIDDVVLHNGMFYRVINEGIANGAEPGTNGAGWFNMYSIVWSSGGTYTIGDYVIHNGLLYKAAVDYNLHLNEPGTSLHWREVGSVTWNNLHNMQ